MPTRTRVADDDYDDTLAGVREPTDEARRPEPLERRVEVLEVRHDALEQRVENDFATLHTEIAEVRGDIKLVHDRTGIMLHHLEASSKWWHALVELARHAIDLVFAPALWVHLVALSRNVVLAIGLGALVVVVLGTAATGLTLAGYGLELRTNDRPTGATHGDVDDAGADAGGADAGDTNDPLGPAFAP